MENRNLDRDKLDFVNGKIGPLFRALFFPTLIGMIFLSALTLIDGIFVGQGVGAEGMAAVNIVAPIFMVATGIGLMFGIGASVIASIRLSENKIKVARIILTQAFVVGILLIGIICLWSFVCPLQVVRMLGCSPQLESAAVSYLLWLLPGLLFMFMQSVGMMLIRLDGSPKYAMSIQIVAAAVNYRVGLVHDFPVGLGCPWRGDSDVDCMYSRRVDGVSLFLEIFRQTEIPSAEMVCDIAVAYSEEHRIHGENRICHILDRTHHEHDDAHWQLYVHIHA